MSRVKVTLQGYVMDVELYNSTSMAMSRVEDTFVSLVIHAEVHMALFRLLFLS